MQVQALIEMLKMYPDDTQVYIQTVPDDMAQPLTMKLMKVWPASTTERYGMEREKLILTAHIPVKD